MSVSVKIDRTHRLVVTRFSGNLTDEDVRRQVQLIAASAPYEGKYSAITDFTHVERFEATTELLRELASQPSPLGSAERVIVAPGEVQYGVSRMFQMLSERTRPHITVVRTMSEALKILNLPTEAP